MSLLARITYPLFRRGLFRLHSGDMSTWKIDCDVMGDDEVITVAMMLREMLPSFGDVEGIPMGGLRLARALRQWTTPGNRTLLIVDDVLTTGVSMEEHRRGREAIGAVIFARGPYPAWVTPLFSWGGIPR